jgi:hypothetical protein
LGAEKEMSREDIQKLLGGYATGTLTSDEQQALFEAALDDQELFDALAREQSLRDLLRDPAAKAQVLAALDERPARWHERFAWWRPAAAVVAMAGLAVFVLSIRRDRAPQPVTVAQVSEPAQMDAIRRAPAAPPEFDRPVAKESNSKAAALEKRRSATPIAVPPPAPPMSASAPLRDSSSGGGAALGGAVGGVIGGVPGGALLAPKTEAPASPPIAAPDFRAPSDARGLFYQSFAPQDTKKAAENTAAAPRQVPQQAGQQGAQQQQQPAAQQSQPPFKQNQPLLMNRVAAPPARTRVSPNPGVRYQILRMAPNGDFSRVDADAVTAGDIVRIEFMPNENGVLMVTSGGRTIFSQAVGQLMTYRTPPLSADDRELTVVFTRSSAAVANAPAGVGGRKDAVRTSSDAEGNYVVGDTASQQVRFTITVNYK